MQDYQDVAIIKMVWLILLPEKCRCERAIIRQYVKTHKKNPWATVRLLEKNPLNFDPTNCNWIGSEVEQVLVYGKKDWFTQHEWSDWFRTCKPQGKRQVLWMKPTLKPSMKISRVYSSPSSELSCGTALKVSVASNPIGLMKTIDFIISQPSVLDKQLISLVL